MTSKLTLELDDTEASSLKTLSESWHLDPQAAVIRAVFVVVSTLRAKPVYLALDALRKA